MSTRLDKIAEPGERAGAVDSPGVPLSERMRRGELFNVACPSRDILKHLTSRWGVLVLLALLDGTLRFAEVRRKVGGVSEKMLSQTLQQLEADGFVDRRAFPVVPPHVDYTLTDLGQEAAVRVRALADWIEVSMPRIAEARERAGQGNRSST